MKKKSLIDACQSYDFKKIEEFFNQFHILNGKALVSETRFSYHLFKPCYGYYENWVEKHVQLIHLLLSNKLILKMVKSREAPFENVFFDLLQTNDTDIMKAFLSYKIDINQKNTQADNALIYCVEHNHTKLIPLLIEQGIDIHYQNKGKNALMLSVLKEKEDIASLLLEAKIDINQEYGVSIGHKKVYTNIIHLALDSHMFSLALKLIKKNDIELHILEKSYFYLDKFLPGYVQEIKEALEEKINIVYEKDTIEQTFKPQETIRQKKVKI